MAQASNIVINDGASVPVAHTFTPIGKDDKGVFWWEQTTPNPANPLGAKRISYRQTRVMDNGNSLTSKSTAIYMIHVPTLETLGTNDAGIIPPPTLAYKEVARVQFDLPDRGLKQERKDTRVLLINLLAVSDVYKTIDDLQPIYA